MLPLPSAVAGAIAILVGSTSASIFAESQANDPTLDSYIQTLDRTGGAAAGVISGSESGTRHQDTKPNLDGRITFTKLHNEELHLAALPDIKPIQDLAGKSMSFVLQGSGARMAATTARPALGIGVEPANHDQAMALKTTKTGEDAATVHVADKPARAVADLKPTSTLQGLRALAGDTVESPRWSTPTS